MNKIWDEMYIAAKKVWNNCKISEYVEASGVAAAILSKSGKIYTGICMDSNCSSGICAERNALFNMMLLYSHHQSVKSLKELDL